MTYKLVYSDRARRDLSIAADFIAQHAPDAAERWFNGFISALSSLETNAASYGLTPESNYCELDIRQFIYRTKSRQANRALYCVRTSTVYILAIRRPGQDLLTREELDQAIAEID